MSYQWRTRQAAVGCGFCLSACVLWWFMWAGMPIHLVAWTSKVKGDPSVSSNFNIQHGQGGGYTEADTVIILAYYRSGSSFLAEIFNQNPEAVYFFEPLRWFSESLVNNTVYLYPNDTRRMGPWNSSLTENKTAILVDVLKELINCSMDDLPKSIYFERNNFRYCTFCNPNEQMHLKEYHRCFVAENDKSYNCTRILKRTCMSSSFRAMKIIRLPLIDLDTILTQFPKVKVIHLLRDPRASINSQRFLTFEFCGISCATNRHCNERMLPDLQHSRIMDQRHPGRILRVFYEDLVKDPILWGKWIYKFLGRRMPDRIKEWLHRATSSTTDNGTWGTTRKNSVKTAHKWKKDMPLKMALQIDEICAKVLRLLPEYQPSYKIMKQSGNMSNSSLGKM